MSGAKPYTSEELHEYGVAAEESSRQGFVPRYGRWLATVAERDARIAELQTALAVLPYVVERGSRLDGPWAVWTSRRPQACIADDLTEVQARAVADTLNALDAGGAK